MTNTTAATTSDLAREFGTSTDTIRRAFAAMGERVEDDAITNEQVRALRSTIDRARSEMSSSSQRVPRSDGRPFIGEVPSVDRTNEPDTGPNDSHVEASGSPVVEEHLAVDVPELEDDIEVDVREVADDGPTEKSFEAGACSDNVDWGNSEAEAFSETTVDTDEFGGAEPDTTIVSSTIGWMREITPTARSTEAHGEESSQLTTGITEEWRPPWFRILLVVGLILGGCTLLSLGRSASAPTAAASQCFDQLIPGDMNSLDPVPCIDSHTYELIGTAEFPAPALAPYPDQATFDQFGAPLCTEGFEQYTAKSAVDTRLDIVVRPPSASAWIDNGARDLTCLVADPVGPRVGSVRFESA